MSYTIYYPVKSQINDLDSLLLGSVVGNTGRTPYGGSDGSIKLWMHHVNKSGSDGGYFAGTEKECSKFRFVGQIHHMFSMVISTWMMLLGGGREVSMGK